MKGPFSMFSRRNFIAEKLHVLVMRKLDRPRCLKHLKNLSYLYRVIKKNRDTENLFTEWFKIAENKCVLVLGEKGCILLNNYSSPSSW